MDTKKSLYARYSAFTVFFYISLSLSNYISVYLNENGFTGTQIGAIMSVSSLAAAVSLPVWGIVSDKLGSARKTMAVCIAIYATFFFLVPRTLQTAVGPIFLGVIFIVVSRSFTGPCNHLAVGWTVRQTSLNGINYSSVRLWGSIGFAVMMMILSFVMPHTGTSVIFYLVPASAACVIVPFFSVKENTLEEQKVRVKDLKPGRVLKNYYFMTYLVMVVGMVVYDSLTAVYMPFLVESVGASTTSTALILGVRCLFEMIAMLAAVRIKKRVPLPYLLIAAGAMITAEHMLYGSVGSLTGILLVTVLSGYANGTYLGLGPSYVYSIIPPELNNTAQTICGSVAMATAIAGSFIGGVLIDKIGVRDLFFGCGFMILAIIIFFTVSLVTGRKVFGGETPRSVFMPIDK